MLKKVRKMMSDRKGFTLVELIVVLVILSVLAAMLAPTMTGYIDKAKEKKVEAKLHQVVVAAQALVDEAYALGDEEYATVTLEAIAELAELKVGEGEDNLTDVIVEIETGKVVYAELEVGDTVGYYDENGGIVSGSAGTAPTGTDYAEIHSVDDDEEDT